MIKPGDVVTWTSRSGGYEKTKTGYVVAVLEPGESIEPYMGPYPKSRVMVHPSTYVSRVPRYVVDVVPSGKHLPRMYAPLRSIVDAQNPDLAGGTS